MALAKSHVGFPILGIESRSPLPPRYIPSPFHLETGLNNSPKLATNLQACCPSPASNWDYSVPPCLP